MSASCFYYERGSRAQEVHLTTDLCILLYGVKKKMQHKIIIRHFMIYGACLSLTHHLLEVLAALFGLNGTLPTPMTEKLSFLHVSQCLFLSAHTYLFSFSLFWHTPLNIILCVCAGRGFVFIHSFNFSSLRQHGVSFKIIHRHSGSLHILLATTKQFQRSSFDLSALLKGRQIVVASGVKALFASFPCQDFPSWSYYSNYQTTHYNAAILTFGLLVQPHKWSPI